MTTTITTTSTVSTEDSIGPLTVEMVETQGWDAVEALIRASETLDGAMLELFNGERRGLEECIGEELPHLPADSNYARAMRLALEIGDLPLMRGAVQAYMAQAQ
jgi:hypothetical protein